MFRHVRAVAPVVILLIAICTTIVAVESYFQNAADAKVIHQKFEDNDVALKSITCAMAIELDLTRAVEICNGTK